MSNVSVVGEAPPPPKFNLYDLETMGLGTTGTVKAFDKDRVIKSYHPNEEEAAQVEQNIYKRLGAHPRITKILKAALTNGGLPFIILEKLQCPVLHEELRSVESISRLGA